MSTEVIVALIVLLGGSLTVLGNYLIGRRQTSGNVSTSDAATLWLELNAIKDEYKERADKYEKQLEENNRQLQSVMEQLTKLQSKGDKMIRKIDDLKRIIGKLRAENQRLMTERKKEPEDESRTA